ncbi:hypothetical protein [Roseovarius mucosus]|uniref:hypothetical protein n=1 Tax=Roseovarius mucosus TaxID=215743 RepID=UPI003F72A884
MTQAQVIEKYSGNTVAKLTSEKRMDHLGPNNPSLGTRYIYHQTDGHALYSKRTDKGYSRQEAGRWWAGNDKICYSMRVTQAEDPEGDTCAPAGTDVVWSSFERGDTKGLRRSVTVARGGQSDIGFGWDKVIAAAGVAMAGAVAVGAASEKLCGPGGCTGGDYSSASAQPQSSSSGGSQTSSSAPRETKSGYTITERINYERNAQTVVARGRCADGKTFNVRYHPDNNPQFFIYGSGGSSVDAVASRFCS